MDFLSEEQTLKYLNRSSSVEIDQKSPSVATTAELVQQHSGNSSEKSPTPSGSLPESDRQQQQNSEIRNRIHESNFENPAFSNAREAAKDGSDIEDDNVVENNEVTKSSSML